MAKQNENSIQAGAAWVKTSKNGNEYLSVSLDLPELLKALGVDPEGLEKVSLMMFPNTKKSADNQPDYRLTYFMK